MSKSIDTPAVRSESFSNSQATRNLAEVFWQRKWLIVLGLASGLVVGALLYARSKPVYRSAAKVLVIKKRSDVVPMAGGDPTQSFLEDYVSTHIVLMKSPIIIEEAVKNGGLADLKTFQNVGNPVDAISAGLEVTRDDPSSNRTIISLTFKGPHPEETAKILDELIASYVKFLEGAYDNVSRETESLFTKAKELLKNDLATHEKKYREFRENSPIMVKGKDGNNLHYTRISEVETKRSNLIVRKAELEGRLKAFQDAKDKGNVDVAILLASSLSEGSTSSAAGRTPPRSAEELLFPLLLEEEELLQDYGIDHPRVKSVRLKIARTREFIEGYGIRSEQLSKSGMTKEQREEAFTKYVRSLEQELSLIAVSLKALDDLMVQELKQAKLLNQFELQDEALRTDVTRTQQLYEQTIKRLQEINLVRNFGGYSAKLIAPPGNGMQIAPSLARMALVATLLGLMAGFGLAYLADITDRSFRSPEEIRRRLGLPIMGHVPHLLEANPTGKAHGQDDQAPDVAPSVCVYHRPTSLDAEAFRSLRTALYFGTRGSGQKIIQITSPNMSEGKSTLISNLAVVIAQSGKRVVVIDADCRRPRIHKMLGLLPTSVGLTSILTGETPWAEAIVETKIANLSVIPCGTRPNNPAELLTSSRLDDLLKELSEHFDYVLVDTPPVLAVTDPAVVASRVDGVLLTIRVSKNGRPAAERAKEVLNNVGANLLGVVVNGVGRDSSGSGYGYRYYYYDEYRYEYRSSEEEAKPHELNGKGHHHVS